MIREEIENIRSLVNSFVASVMRGDIFESLKFKLGVRAKLLELDVETRWSSPFIIIKSLYVASRIFNAVFNRVRELSDFRIT